MRLSPRSTRPRQRGSIAVEFALVFPILLLMAVGLAVVAQVSVAKIRVTHAAWLGQTLLAQGVAPAVVQQRVCRWLTGGGGDTTAAGAGSCEVAHRPGEGGLLVYQVRYRVRTGASGVSRVLGRERTVVAEWLELGK